MYTAPPTDPIAFVDWYMDHMRTNLNRDMWAVRMWSFDLRTKDVDGMHALAKTLRKARYLTTVQEVVEEIIGVGRKRKKVAGPPLVTAFSRGKPSAAALKRRVRSLIALAEKHDARYESLSSMDMDEFEMFYGPPKAIPLADACWRLRHHSDMGLDHGAKIDYHFCLVAQDVKACTAALKKAGFAKVARAPKDANWTISVRVPGANDERRLQAEYAAMRKAAKSCGASLKGLEM
jgi:hypothetical protein